MRVSRLPATHRNFSKYLTRVVMSWVVIIGVIGFIIFRIWMNGSKYTKNTQIKGKVVVITGANTGIGKATALELAKRGGRVYLACRDPKKGESAVLEVIQGSGNRQVRFLELDLSSFGSIRKFAQEFLDNENRLDVLINNAGVFLGPYVKTQDGLERQMGVNHYGHFLLTYLLIGALKRSKGRIVNVSSVAHLSGKIDKEDINSERSYSPFRVYAQSKLANVLFTRELARKLQGSGVTANSLHPGTVNSDATRHLGGSLSWLFTPSLIKTIFRPFIQNTNQGAQTSVKLAVDPDLSDVSGKYFDNLKEAKVNPLALDDDLAKWLWEQSKRTCGIRDSSF